MEHLIPERWFVGLDFWLLFVIGGAATAVLLMGADRLVEGASGIAVRLGMPKVIVGATIVSLGTTSPEAAVSVMAAWGGNAGLALGNGIGSIIFDSGLIFGVGCLMTRLPADRFVLARQGWVQFGAGLLLAVICYGLFISHGLAAGPPRSVEFLRAAKLAEIGRGVGIFLVVLLVGYLYLSVRWARQHPVGEPFIAPEDFEEAKGVIPHAHPPHGTRMLLVYIIGGLVAVLVSSHVLVQCAVQVCLKLGMSQVVVSSTIVATGTSLPELMIGISAIRKNHGEILVGNIIGADILNVLFVIGASATAAPLAICDPVAPTVLLTVHLPTLLLILALFRIFIVRSHKTGYFERWYGVPLLAIVGVYVALLLGG